MFILSGRFEMFSSNFFSLPPENLPQYFFLLGNPNVDRRKMLLDIACGISWQIFHKTVGESDGIKLYTLQKVNLKFPSEGPIASFYF